uniref:Uncharacterized protein n=1 Tax=Cucumis melo TaxID=3656 RepID=A0A9I9D0Y0_CUCME
MAMAAAAGYTDRWVRERNGDSRNLPTDGAVSADSPTVAREAETEDVREWVFGL